MVDLETIAGGQIGCFIISLITLIVVCCDSYEYHQLKIKEKLIEDIKKEMKK